MAVITAEEVQAQILEFDHRRFRKEKAEARAREWRWNTDGCSRVEHPKYGSVVVPHISNYAAVLNAAEYWGCDWLEIIDAQVWRAGPEDGRAVTMPALAVALRNAPAGASFAQGSL